jgi:multiple sugar transport system substrate-binding protein
MLQGHGRHRRNRPHRHRHDKRGTARARLVPRARKANEQREQYRDRIAAGSCDVVFLDVIYGSEFADDDLLYDLSDYIEQREEKGTSFHDGMLRTVKHDGRLWGVPKQLDGGVLYYRRDQGRPPSTWPRLLDAAAGRKLLRLALDAYEGATVAFLDLAYAADADDIVSADGKRARLVQEGTRAALAFLLEATRRKALPSSVFRQGERGSLSVYELGRAKLLA